MKVLCKNCNIECEKSKTEVNRTINSFCSRSCAATYNNKKYPKCKKQKPKTGNCFTCSSQIPIRNKYCKTCRVTGPPKSASKKYHIKICTICQHTIAKNSNRRKYCDDCFNNGKHIKKQARRTFKKDPTLKDVCNSNGFKTNSWANVRYRARAKIKQLGINKCQHPDCDYDRHVEVCHKKAISTFDLDTPLSVVNSIDNLIVLCPNHHWEFDHPE